MGAGVVQVRPEIVLKEIRPRWSLQSVLEQVDRPAIQTFVSLDHPEHVVAPQHRTIKPTRTRLADIAAIVQVILDPIDHCFEFLSSPGIKPALTSSS